MNAHGFVQQQSVDRASDGGAKGIRITRDGAVIEVPWLQALCLEGRMFGAQCGDASCDPVGEAPFGDTGVDLDEFDWLQVIPATVAVLPVYFAVGYLAIGAAGEAGLHLVWGAGGVLNAGSITVTPFNMRPSSGVVSACTIAASEDGGGTAITVAGVIYEQVTTALTGVAATPAQFVPEFSVAKVGYIPVLEGAVQMAAFCPGQAAPTGYIVAAWAELPISAIE